VELVNESTVISISSSMNGVAVPKATQGNANGSVTLTTANPPSIEMPGLCPAK
jgi:hypothetical protein